MVLLKTWNIYRSEQGKFEFIPNGFNFWAFLFTGIWAVFKNLKIIGITAISSGIALNRMPLEMDMFVLPSLLLIHILFGFKGNSWRSAHFEKNGYRLIKQVKAASIHGAKSQVSLDELLN